MRFTLRIDETLELRLLEERDAAAIFVLVEANRQELSRWLPWVQSTVVESDVAQFLKKALRQFARGGGFHTGIYHRGVLAGMIGLHEIDWGNRRVELGYWLDSAQQGNGLMTRAAGFVTRYCLEDLELNRTEIQCASENTKSCAIASRLGYQLEGSRRRAQVVQDNVYDINIYGMTRRPVSG